MRILVTGSDGQVGTELTQQARKFGIASVGKDRDELDICDRVAVKKVVKSLKPNCIINAAAYTAVDAAELDRDRAYAVNDDGAKNLAWICDKTGIPFMHISTDYVFDGKLDGAYAETDSTNPLSVYGASKLAGERSVQAACTKNIILRTSWVFSEHGENFVKSMLRLGAERETLSVVSDQYGGPTPAYNIAQTLLRMIVKIPGILADDQLPWGVYHYHGSPVVSWHQFAEEIFLQARKRDMSLLLQTLSTIATENYPVQARRPVNAVLDCSKIRKVFDIDQPDWREGLKAVMDKLV